MEVRKWRFGNGGSEMEVRKWRFGNGGSEMEVRFLRVGNGGSNLFFFFFFFFFFPVLCDPLPRDNDAQLSLRHMSIACKDRSKRRAPQDNKRLCVTQKLPSCIWCSQIEVWTNSHLS